MILSKSSLLNIAVIGCGRIAGHHCQSITVTPGINLVAVCDLDLQKASNYGLQFSVPSYVNYHEMFACHPEINIVVLATPSGMHFEHGMDIIQNYRKNLIVEKPTFMNPTQLDIAYKAADELMLRIFPVFQNRHNLAVQRVHDGLLSGELGKIQTVSVRVRWCRPQHYYDLAPWRGTFAMDGGCLTNQGIHHLDLMRYLGGEVESLFGAMTTLGADIEVEDLAVGAMKFMNGALGTLEVTTAARPIDYEASLSIVCDKGLAQIGGIAVNELQIYTPDTKACELFSEDFSGNVYGNGHQKIYREIVESFQNDQSYSVGYRDVLATIKLLNAFYISDEKQDRVQMMHSGDSTRLGRRDEVLENLYRTI